MWVLLTFLLFIAQIAAGIRREQHAGIWSWSKFLFAICFGVGECALIIVPITYIVPRSLHPVAVCVTVCVMATLNFVWFIIVARRWKLPDGRTSLQAYRDEHNS
jgi:hypothetical protein